jgi:P4 family phage/plasmid primase-like protien
MNLFKEFPKIQKAECFEYSKSKNIACWQRDINDSGAKILLADSYENIFNNIKNDRNHYYEYWSSTQPIKLFIDYDRKSELIDPTNQTQIIDEENNYKQDISNIIYTIKSLIPTITNVYILKSVPNFKKKSYHIIFDGVYFLNRSIMKHFMDEQVKPKHKDLFDKKIIDVKVYGELCFRTLLSTKAGENRPLYIIDTNLFLSSYEEKCTTMDNTTLEDFLNACISNVNDKCKLFNYKQEKKKKQLCINEEEDGDIYSDKTIVKRYLDILDADRYTDYNKWINVGFILFSINPDYIDLWHSFSKQSDNYDEAKCNYNWNTFSNSEYIYTLNTLIHLARIDNHNDCLELSNEIPNHDVRFLRPLDNILSKYIHRLYGEHFVCSDPKKDEWYFFNSNRWKKENKSLNLRQKIINHVFNNIDKYFQQLKKEGANDSSINNFKAILKTISTGIKLNCLDIEFYNENFYKIIDQNKDLIGFENGVFDLINMKFRKGVSSDYISLTTGYDYKYYSPEEPVYQELLSLIYQILPHRETREFTLKSLASCLDGHTRDENFYIWSGKNASGGNGKSTLTELLAKALGEYAIDSPVSLITGKRESSNNANSALVATRNKRVVIMQEPGVNDIIQADVLKSLTGGDKVSTRELHGSQVEFKPHFKAFIATNKLPAVSDIDGGVTRRLKITEFISRFVHNPNQNNDYLYEYQIDKELKSKLDVYKTVFMCILIDYYKIYRAEGLEPPRSVLKVTKRYEDNNNNIKTFIEENIVKATKTDFITLDEIKNIYKTDQIIRNSFPKVNNFISQLENALCSEFKIKQKIKRIDGYCLRGNEIDNDDDLDNNDDNDYSDSDSEF